MFWIKFKGKDSREMGVTILRRPNIISPHSVVTFVPIDGRDTPLVHELGTTSYEITLEIAVEHIDLIDEVQGWIQGEGEFVRSDLPNRYQNVRVINGISFTRLVENLYTASVTLVTYEPYFYPLEEQTALVGTSTELTNEGNYKSFPEITIIRASGTSSTLIEYNNNQIRYHFPLGEREVTIDTATRTAISGGEDRSIFLEIERDYGLHLPVGTSIVTRDRGTVEFRKYSRWI